jgi:cellulose biosynthesis protein BcsQ
MSTTVVICVASAKGGSGKTVFTSALGHFLAALKHRTLLIDTDAATNGLSLFYLNQVIAHRERLESRTEGTADRRSVMPAGIFDAAKQQGQLSTVRLDHRIELLPATYRSLNTESISPADFRSSLSAILGVASGTYDYVLLDAQAGADPIAAIAMGSDISDRVVLVSEYDPLSAAGAERLKSLFPDDLAYERTWMLINKMLPEFAPSVGEFLQIARYLSPIPWEADVVRAYAQRTLALDLEHGNDYTLAIVQSARGLLGPEMEADIDRWIEGRAAAIREPILSQIRDLDTEAKGLGIERRRLKQRGLQRRLAGFATAAGLTLFGGVIALIASNVVVLLVTLALAAAPVFLAFNWDLVEYMVPSLKGEEEDDHAEERLRDRERDIERRKRSLKSLAEADPEALLRSGERPGSVPAKRPSLDDLLF